MTETPPIQCSCGVTAFADIRVNTVGVMSMTCFHCRQTMHFNVPIAMAEQAWQAMERRAPEPEPAEPEKPVARGYKYEAML